ncbi:hypothetical protein LUZ60_013651 [Juncus effusus]|nr:hypothetical protein LUZ60_013651 [Juncus effusus]
MFSLVKYGAPILVELPNLIREIPSFMRALPNFEVVKDFQMVKDFQNLKDLSVWDFDWDKTMQAWGGIWKNHKRKVMVSFGALGGGYFIYKIYEGYRYKITNGVSRRDFSKAEAEDFVHFDGEKAVEEVIKLQLKNHFESTQRISDAITLPGAMHFLRERVGEKLDLSYYMEKLMQTKAERGRDLSKKDRLLLWDSVKVLSFTRATTALWTMTLLTLYAGVQVSILGRHLYQEMMDRSNGSHSLNEADTIGKTEREQYLNTADYLSRYGITSLIMNMRTAASQVLKQTQINKQFSMEMLQDTMNQILDEFMGVRDEPGLCDWIDYLLPENATQYRELIAMSANGFDDSPAVSMDVAKLEQLISETREALSSEDFKSAVESSLRKGVEMLIEEIRSAEEVADVMPLAKHLPRVAQLSVPLLEDPSSNKFIHALRNEPQVLLFNTFLYANIPRGF